METKKQKVVKILKRIAIALSVGFNVIFLIAIIIGSSGIKNKGNNVQGACAESEVVKVDSQVNKKFVSYNDESYTITINVNELNSYTFVNLANCFSDLYDINNQDIIVSFSYNSYISNFYIGNGYGTSEGDYFIIFNYGTYIGLASTSYTFTFVDSDTDLPLSDDFVYDLALILNNDIYNSVKFAIESDIQANEGNINDGIFETLTSGVVAFIGSIGSGITAMTSVFYDSANSQLTTIGLLSVIVVSITLSYFLFRLIIGLIRMRG